MNPTRIDWRSVFLTALIGLAGAVLVLHLYVLAFAVAAHAQAPSADGTLVLPTAVPDVPIAVTLARIVTDVTLHKWLALAGVVMGLIVSIGVTHASGITTAIFGGFFRTDAGGVVWTFILAAIGSLAATFAAGQPPSRVTVLGAVALGVSAISGYTGLRKLFNTKDGLGKVFPRAAWVIDLLGAPNPPPKQLESP